MPGSAIAKARHVRHSFGTPSTPFSPHGNSGASSIFGKGAIFGSGFGFGGLTRRGSFLGIENEDLNGSPDEKGDSQSSDQYELPPTPTKQAPLPSDRISKSGNGTPFTGYSMPNLSANGHGMRKAPRTSSKLKILFSSDDSAMEEDDSISPNCLADSGFRLSSPSISSFGRSRALRGAILSSPAPLVPKSLASYLSPSKKRFTKSTRVVPASPLERIDFFERVSPHTPQEAMLPPDPSGLSISNKKDKDAHAFNAGAMLPPATPTSGREYFPQFGDRRTSVTPINGFIAPEVDEALTSRFEKVELIGTGEFSQVYKVTQSTIHTNAHLFFRASHTPPTPIAGRIFAVKKARQPFQGIRDRNRKLQEVNVLRALRNSDHVVQFVDSWDEKDHLYIQTEYCEEGSLDIFLSQVGRKGRLDDFRIWKILIELSQVSPSCPVKKSY
jgi:mitosis inhibitor protein kinase SWE1